MQVSVLNGEPAYAGGDLARSIRFITMWGEDYSSHGILNVGEDSDIKSC